MSYLDRLKAEFPETTLDRQLPKVPKAPYGSYDSSPSKGVSEIEAVNTPQQPPAIARETEDLREAFEERAGILEHDAGLPRHKAELEAARITATLARNRGYTWASLRAALAGCTEPLAQVPDRPGPVDTLHLGAAKLAVLPGRRVVRQGAFTGGYEVKA